RNRGVICQRSGVLKKTGSARPGLALRLETLQTTYPPRGVRTRRPPEIAFLSAVSGKNVQPGRRRFVFVHELSTELVDTSRDINWLLRSGAPNVVHRRTIRPM